MATATGPRLGRIRGQLDDIANLLSVCVVETDLGSPSVSSRIAGAENFVRAAMEKIDSALAIINAPEKKEVE